MPADAGGPRAIITALDESRSDIRLAIEAPTFSIGRAPENDLCLKDDKTASRRHCIIHVGAFGLILEDNGSRNGTYLNGKRVSGRVPLPLPSWLIVGKTRLAVVPASVDDEDDDSLEAPADATQGSLLLAPTAIYERRSEAFLVVDVVNSTELVRQGEVQVAEVILALGQILDGAQQAEREPFLKCTGDGFFACFSTAEAALNAAAEAGRELSRQVDLPVQLSIALHYGSAHLTALGDRVGKDVHAVFALENVRRADLGLEEEMRAGSQPVLTLMTAAFWSRLSPAERSRATLLGSFQLRGLDEKTRVFRWPS